MRYMVVHRSDISRSMNEILRLVQAFRRSGLTREALVSKWIPGGEVILTDFPKKVEYLVNKLGHGRKLTMNILRQMMLPRQLYLKNHLKT